MKAILAPTAVLDLEQEGALALWRSDLEAIASRNLADQTLARECNEMLWALAQAFGRAYGPDDVLWRHVYVLGLRVLDAARHAGSRPGEGALALRRVAEFIEENRDLG
jgi:hypothetical protein